MLQEVKIEKRNMIQIFFFFKIENKLLATWKESKFVHTIG